MSFRVDDTALPPLAAAEDVPMGAPVGPWRRRIRGLVRNRGAMIALGFLLLLTLAAIFQHEILRYGPNVNDIPHKDAAASWSHPLGTDDLGRDVLSRLIVGAGVSMRFSLEAVFLAAIVALPIGLLSGYVGGRLDNLLMRFVDAGLSFPPLILALAIAGVLGASLDHAIIAISIVMIPGFIRGIRGVSLAVAQEPFIEASRSIGTPTRRILFKRVLPNVRSILIVGMSLSFGAAILAETGLSFLNLSVQAPDASWGNMLRRGFDYSLYTHPWQLVAPGVAIVLTVLAFNTLGDGVRDVLSPSTWAPLRLGGSRWWPFGRSRGQKTRRGITVVTRRDQPTAPQSARLLAVEQLSVEFDTDQGPLRVVDDVTFHVDRGEVLGLVGESGSGKTVTSLSIMRLLGSPPARIAEGAVYFEGRDLLTLSFDELRDVRGSEISMVFQDPMTSLDPAFTIGNQLVEALRLHEHVDKATARARALEMLDLVQITAPEQRLDEYPHQLSGGMRQRVMLAVALICRPKLLIADEPTTALDVTVQAQILDLLRALQSELSLSVIFVTHDFGVVADICDRVAVMYAGQIVEHGPTLDVFAHPEHPYTEGLLTAMPQTGTAGDALYVIPGQVPHPRAWPSGCRFHPRCAYAQEVCRASPVTLGSAPNVTAADKDSVHEVRCVRSSELTLRGAE